MADATYTHTRGEGETTEWEDIQRKLGNFAPVEDKKAEEAAAREAAEEAEAARDPHEGKTVDDLDEELEEADEEDEAMLRALRDKRLAEMRAAAEAAKFGSVLEIGREDYERQVTFASDDAPVVLMLYQSYLEASNRMGVALDGLAKRHPDVKFVRIKADACIKDYPDRNVPTLFVYNKRELVESIHTLATLGGKAVSPHVLEWRLAQLGIMSTELEENPLLSLHSADGFRLRRDVRSPRKGGRRWGGDEDDDDDDYDSDDGLVDPDEDDDLEGF